MSSAAVIGVAGDLLLSILQAYFIAARQQNMTAEQAKARFVAAYDQFMADTEAPVEEVKE